MINYPKINKFYYIFLKIQKSFRKSFAYLKKYSKKNK